MKRTLSILLLVTLIHPSLSFAQKKSTSSVNKHAVIDALAKKYKDVSSIVLSTPNGSVVANVTVSYNESGMPFAVIFSGIDSFFTFNSKAVSDVPKIQSLFNTLKKQKLANGFKYSEALSEINNEVYVKGNIYSRFFVRHAYSPYFEKDHVDLYVRQSFEISTIDFSRSGGVGSSKFDF